MNTTVGGCLLIGFGALLTLRIRTVWPGLLAVGAGVAMLMWR